MRGMAVIEVRKAIEADCKYYIDIHCPEARAMSREERLRRCGYWADYDACVFYLGLYRRLSGEVFTALVDDDIVGEIELLPHDDCLLGPRAYINVLWVKESKRGIGVGTSLVREAVRWAQRKGYKYLDTIPEEQSIGFYSKMEFRRLALQVKALKQLKKTVASVDYEFMELSAGDTPTGMKLITGVYRPGLFTWCSAWKDKYLPPRIDPLAYRLIIEDKSFIVLLDYYSEGKVSLVSWALEKPSPDLFKKILLVSESLAVNAGISEIFVQTWKEYEDTLTSLGYKMIGETVWLSKNISRE